MASQTPRKGQEGMHLPEVPMQDEAYPFSRNPEPRGGGAREALCYAQPLATVMDVGAPQSPLGSESPSSPNFIANPGRVASRGLAGRDSEKDTQPMTYNPRANVSNPPAQWMKGPHGKDKDIHGE